MKTSKIKYKEIHEILLKHWDPVGVKGLSNAQDEYDSFIPSVVSLLSADIEAEQMCEELMMIAVFNMGVARTDELLESSKKAAEELLALKRTKES